ncbi:MAG TPA: hypothetical protein EYH59_02550 [Pyrodictium sp.]|nr:hypothetical protein [Pyrodictium sp.]
MSGVERTGNNTEYEAPFWEHVVELSVRLRRIVCAILISSIVLSVLPANWDFSSGAYVPLISHFPSLIIQTVLPKQVGLFGRTYNVVIMPESPFETFQIILLSALLLGSIGASPIIAREVWAYLEPALYPHEKKMVKKLVVISVSLFLFGIWLAVYIVTPWTLRITLSIYPFFVPQGYEAIIRVSVSDVVTLTIELALALGVVLQTPLIMYYLLAGGILDPSMFSRESMKIAFVVMLFVGAIISPDPSGLGMIVIALLLYLPFYIAVKLGEKAYYKRILQELVKEEEISVIKLKRGEHDGMQK